MPELVVGPMLRYVDETSASVWVETSEPCEVTIEVGGTRSRARTFTVHGHHYAIVDVEGGGTYEVRLEGRPSGRFRTSRPAVSGCWAPKDPGG
ncbi:hypothetical protein ACFQX6_27215 [Streptosporangium lutulentum]